mmetsp:Transcript_81855/g.226855  ORF Transcript_81855/g.226855 Transcript_81855/m.226855 type:complete len:213 (-) Transcript_81855:229-867(-)
MQPRPTQEHLMKWNHNSSSQIVAMAREAAKTYIPVAFWTVAATFLLLPVSGRPSPPGSWIFKAAWHAFGAAAAAGSAVAHGALALSFAPSIFVGSIGACTGGWTGQSHRPSFGSSPGRVQAVGKVQGHARAWRPRGPRQPPLLLPLRPRPQPRRDPRSDCDPPSVLFRSWHAVQAHRGIRCTISPHSDGPATSWPNARAMPTSTNVPGPVAR